MEEYEVELVDYMRVIWKGKWIILACLVVAIVSSVVVMWTRPTNYTASASYYLRWGFVFEEFPALDVQEVAASLKKVTPLSGLKGIDLHAVRKEEEVALSTSAPDGAEVPKEGRIDVTLTGAVTEGAFRESITQLTPLVKEIVNEQAERRYEMVVVELELKLVQMSQQRDLFQARLVNQLRIKRHAEVIRRLEIQIDQLDRERDMLEETIAEITPSADGRLSSVAMRLSEVVAAIVKRQIALEALRAGDLDEVSLLTKAAIVIAEDPELSFLTTQVNALEASISEQAVALEWLKAAQLEELILVSLVKEPLVSTGGHNRRLTLAVAAVLGLFIGVLLAFFVHYLATVREREKRRAKP